MNHDISLVDDDGRIYPCILRPARYKGNHSGGRWHAWPVARTELIPGGAYGSNVASSQFWTTQQSAKAPIVGVGDTPLKAKVNLRFYLMKAGRHKPNPPDPKEVSGLSVYAEQASKTPPQTIQGARRHLRCAIGMQGADYEHLIESLDTIEEIIGKHAVYSFEEVSAQTSK